MQMQSVKLRCRVCKKITNHADLDAGREMNLGDGLYLVQCGECGVMGIERIEGRDEA